MKIWPKRTLLSNLVSIGTHIFHDSHKSHSFQHPVRYKYNYKLHQKHKELEKCLTIKRNNIQINCLRIFRWYECNLYFVNGSTAYFGILTLPYQFLIKFALRSDKFTDAPLVAFSVHIERFYTIDTLYEVTNWLTRQTTTTKKETTNTMILKSMSENMPADNENKSTSFFS